ncbi:type II methionyl aminopeptidase [Candidatus Woesearchaeota archaeon]|nr:type II methionyl aminopeptidase [Candidatus Woesearchaeota archaeon]
MEQQVKLSYIKAGKIAAQSLEFGKGLIKKDAVIADVLDKIEKKIEELGGKPAFPAQVSLDHVAAHFCPDEGDNSAFGESLANLDVGVHVDGYIGDNACTVDLTGKYGNLVKASNEALEAALKVVKEGVTLGEIGRAIHSEITKYGYSPVRNLSGHGLGHYKQHEPPSIPNFDTGDTEKIEKGMVFAIEPFASTGSGIVQDSGEATVYMLAQKKPVRSPIAREVLKEIESYNGLPFCRRWLTRKFGAKARLGLRELMLTESIRPYPPLADTKKGIVSQAEHSVLIGDEVLVLTKLI